MTIDDEIRDEKLQYHINRENSKISALSSGIDKYEYLTGKEILPFDQWRGIEQGFRKTKKNNWRSRKETNRCY